MERNKRQTIAAVVSVVGLLIWCVVLFGDLSVQLDYVLSFLGIGLLVATAVYLYRFYHSGAYMATEDEIGIRPWGFYQFLTSAKEAGILWFALRVGLGLEWLEAGWHKVTDPAWMSTGDAILGFWQRAAATPAAPAKSPVTYDMYRAFLQMLIDSGSHPWFAKLIVFGELAIGLGLILGCLTGIAAFFAALLNLSFLLAGTTSTNPFMLILALGLLLSWQVAGYWGIDRYLLPKLRAPWDRRAEPIHFQDVRLRA